MTTPQGTVELTEIVFPAEANHYGTLFGGNALQLMAKAGDKLGDGVGGIWKIARP